MILDIIAVILIGYCIYKGVKKGFVKAFLGTATLIIAFVLTSATLAPVTDYVKESPLGDAVYDNINFEFLKQEDLESVQELLDKYNLTEALGAENMVTDIKGMEEDFALKTGDLVIRALCTVLLFIAYVLALKLLTLILDAFCKLPILKTFNKAGGFIAGAINAYIFLMVFACIIMLLLSTTLGTFLSEQLEGSYITAWAYRVNPFM